MMRILNFGSCNIDYVYALEHIVLPGETLTTRKLTLFPGGKGLNQSIAIARAGMQVFHAGCLGSDGDMLREVMLESGVDLRYVKNVPGKNGHAVIQVSEDGENSIFLYPGSNAQVTTAYIDTVLEEFTKGDMLLLQNEISNTGYLIEKAYQKGMYIVFNPSPFEEALKSLDYSMLSCLVLNEVEARGLTGCGKPEDSIDVLRKQHPELRIVLTLGKRGSIYADKDQIFHQHAFAVKAVDTTGAGDTFTGFFVAGLAGGAACRDILRVSSAAAALAVCVSGAASSIPMRTDVETFLLKYEKDGRQSM